MRILITSGGTKVPLDPVRSITNKSTGRFGAALAKEALRAGAEVIYLTSQEGLTPFVLRIDFNKEDDVLSKIEELHKFSNTSRSRYHEYRYDSFVEYRQQLKQLIQQFQPDIVILSAAVSDYLVSNYSIQKIRSHDDLQIKLEQAPKVINEVKQWLPHVFLVGFKLLIDAPDTELVEAALHSIKQNHADIVVANNLSTLMRGEHEILLVEKTGDFKKIKQQLAEHLIARVLQR